MLIQQRALGHVVYVVRLLFVGTAPGVLEADIKLQLLAFRDVLWIVIEPILEHTLDGRLGS